MTDEFGPPVAPGPLAGAVDDLTDLVKRIGQVSADTAEFSAETRAMLAELERRSVRNWNGVRIAVALLGVLALILGALAVSLFVTVSRQNDRIADALIRSQVDKERNIRDACDGRNEIQATVLGLVRAAEPGPAFVMRAEEELAPTDCDAKVRASREAVGVPPRP